MEENINIQGQPENNGSEGETSLGEMDVKKINVNIIDGGRDGSNIKEPKKENKFLSGIVSFIKSKRSYIFAFFIPALLLFAAYACFGVHPFGDMSVLVLDLNGQYVYYFENLRDIQAQ